MAKRAPNATNEERKCLRGDHTRNGLTVTSGVARFGTAHGCVEDAVGKVLAEDHALSAEGERMKLSKELACVHGIREKGWIEERLAAVIGVHSRVYFESHRAEPCDIDVEKQGKCCRRAAE